MVTVKMLKPYYIKADINHVRVILAYQYFSILINEQLYHFVPMKAKEIRIDRKTKKIVNIEAEFAFQKGKEIIYISMMDLIPLPEFLIQLHFIVESYYRKGEKVSKEEVNIENMRIIEELEELNLKRLIDKSLDERNEESFDALARLL